MTANEGRSERTPPILFRFSDILPVEHRAIEARRQRVASALHLDREENGRRPVKRMEPDDGSDTPSIGHAQQSSLSRAATSSKTRRVRADVVDYEKIDRADAERKDKNVSVRSTPSARLEDAAGPPTADGQSPSPRPHGARAKPEENKERSLLADGMSPKPVMFDTVGLALSGGGIRSATFSLGALQALEEAKALDAIDYLSTVSGGGYAGCATVAAMSRSKGAFPFASGADVSDSPEVGHLRNFSNYLMPRDNSSFRNAVEIAIIYGRGLFGNAIYVGLVLAMFALLVAIAYPRAGALSQNGFVAALVGSALPASRASGAFDISVLRFAMNGAAAALTVFSLGVVFWLIARSVCPTSGNDVDSGGLGHVRRMAYFCLGIVAFESIPPLVGAWGQFKTWMGGSMIGWGSMISAAATALLAFVPFANRLMGILTNTAGATGLAPLVKRAASWTILTFAGLAVPIILSVVFLASTHALVENRATIAGWLPIPNSELSLFVLLLVLVIIFTLAALVLKPNSYSLHQFYRDRLSKAFLSPVSDVTATKATTGSELPGSIEFSQIDTCNAPYPLINTSINLQGSKIANMRGRDADFFVFTPKFVGSDLTRYVTTNVNEQYNLNALDKRMDLGRAMAISGAAVSSNMGSSFKMLAPSLSLLNARLGYWLRNPRTLDTGPDALPVTKGGVKGYLGGFLLIEMLGAADESMERIYLTDGGHIENLGIYELLKRGCHLIVVVDAEADAQYNFPSFLRLARYARIDFGVRIDLPWERIAETSRRVDLDMANRTPLAPRAVFKGPHAAIGVIHYPDGCQGMIVYVKSSFTGDERDYIRDYKRRYPNFPHESTGDQFFSEEQFEAYRALGFHAMHRLLDAGSGEAVEVPTGSSVPWLANSEVARRELRTRLWTMAAQPT